MRSMLQRLRCLTSHVHRYALSSVLELEAIYRPHNGRNVKSLTHPLASVLAEWSDGQGP